eukprot:CAMPEP_0116034956 /NCGR_PEP_ID=MMETSP0321-20121206/20007_1 /TAXON_ID=163516 /ORGANISM="Leptocylindrus danicus var. danicus, Strain B650" /LENGTH=362 /DNA_ID=CAMNT_0003511549 /DNA_START=18 /DNA_END=1106 /DNA_ORIENTATION=-
MTNARTIVNNKRTAHSAPRAAIKQTAELLETPRKKRLSSARIVTPSRSRSVTSIQRQDSSEEVPSFSLGCFGKHNYQNEVPENVKKVYKIINAKTGRIGGNGHGGAIYGELTMHSMQKMVELMKQYTNFNKSSRFIDVGSGLGKPNLYVAQNPGVEFSFGIEMEHVRNMLGLHNLLHVLKEAQDEVSTNVEENRIGTRCFLKHGNILEAKSMDPFTHVFMFDIGFPPTLFKKLAQMFNRSKSPYLICFHGPKLMIDRYGFKVELLVQTPTNMHGSSEVHTGYVYKRKGMRKPRAGLAVIEEDSDEEVCNTGDLPDVPCDPYFREPWQIVRRGLDSLTEVVAEQVQNDLGSGRPKRNRKPVQR